MAGGRESQHIASHEQLTESTQISFEDIDSILKNHLGESYHDIDEDAKEELSYTIEDMDKTSLQRLGDTLKSEQAGAFSFALLDHLPVSDTETIIQIVENINTKEDTTDTKEDTTDKEEVFFDTKNLDIEKWNSLLEKVRKLNDRLINALWDKFDTVKKQEWDAIKEKISAANPHLNEEQLDIYTNTQILLDHREEFQADLPDKLKADFEQLLKNAQTLPWFKNLQRNTQLKQFPKISNKLKNTSLSAYTGEDIDVEQNRDGSITIGRQTFRSDGTDILKTIESESNYGITRKMDFQPNYKRQAEIAQLKKEYKNLIGESDKATGIYEKQKLAGELIKDIQEEQQLHEPDNDASIVELAQEKIVEMKDQLDTCQRDIKECIDQAHEIKIRIQELYEEQRSEYAQFRKSEIEKDKQTRETLSLINTLWLDQLPQSFLNQIFAEIESGLLIPELWVAFNWQNIDLANQNFWEAEVWDNKDIFIENLTRFSNKLIFGNPEWTDANGVQQGFNIYNIKNNPDSKPKTPAEIFTMMKINNIMNDSGTINIDQIRINLRKKKQEK